MIDRRTFLCGLPLGALAASFAAEAQPAGRMWRIGILQTSAPKDETARVAALEQGLAELGYVGGRNILIVNRNAGQQVSRLPELATELVRSGVDVIVTSVNPATLAAKKATATIPIVMAVGVEPVAAGLVASLAKPGANVTGLTFDVDATQLAGKRLEILKELMPSVSRVAVLWNPGYGPGMLRLRGTEQAGRQLGITIVSVQLSRPGHRVRPPIHVPPRSGAVGPHGELKPLQQPIIPTAAEDLAVRFRIRRLALPLVLN